MRNGKHEKAHVDFPIVLTNLVCLPSQSFAGPITGKTVAVESGSDLDVTMSELKTMLANKDFVFINVHIPFAGNIASTDLSIPYDQIEQNRANCPLTRTLKSCCTVAADI